jgi:hypothetical protein
MSQPPTVVFEQTDGRRAFREISEMMPSLRYATRCIDLSIRWLRYGLTFLVHLSCPTPAVFGLPHDEDGFWVRGGLCLIG